MAMSGDNSRGTGAGAPVPLRQADIVAGPEEANLPQTAGNGKGKKNKAQKKKAKARKKALRQAARAQHGPQAKQVGGKGQGALADIPEVVQVQPIARPARLKTRHWGLIFSFFLLVLAPLCGVIFYLTTYANDQYLSTTGFTVRSQDTGGTSELLGGLAQFAGGTTASDSDILYEFIQSQEMVRAVDAEVDLRAHYTAVWPEDWAFGLWRFSTSWPIRSTKLTPSSRRAGR